jgi:hypothetical protein
VWVAVASTLLIGMALRLVWVEDMEYKADEAWTFERATQADFRRELPWLGMPSSVDLPNPGMSLWVFIGLQELSGAKDPPGLARAVQLANCLALVALVIFAWRVVPTSEREIWLWGAALAAVNPLVVLFHRKLWPPCVLPLCSVALLWGWFRRERAWPAFVWGFVGACLGQIHMSGFFFAGALALWSLLFDRKRVEWKPWLAGSALGAVPLVPWAWYVLMHPLPETVNPHRWVHILEGKFWIRWFTEPFGLGIDYTLGGHFREFLSWPVLGGIRTYLVGAAHVVGGFVALFLLIRTTLALRLGSSAQAEQVATNQSPTAMTLGAALWGFGLLLTLSCCSIHRHYMIVLFPLECVWVARLALRQRAGRTLLGTLWAAQLIISAQFLTYIHQTQCIHAEYGATYRVQQTGSEHVASSGHGRGG